MLIRARYDGKITTLDYDPRYVILLHYIFLINTHNNNYNKFTSLISLGIDTLLTKIKSITIDNIVLVDFGGYVITTHEDLEDIKVVEISDANSDSNIISHNRLYSSSYDENSVGISNNTNNINNNHYNTTNNNENDDWAQHLDLANNSNTETNQIVDDDNEFIHNTHIDAVKDVSYGQSLVRLVAIADVWVVPNNDYCTTIINNEKNDINECEKSNDDDKIIQPCYRLSDTNFNICTRCTRYHNNYCFIN